jgi:Carboxypeptidase regulatory-like domain/TonB-dependent Receptor Plug Domain
MREPLAHREKNLTMKSHPTLSRIVLLVAMSCAAAWAQDTASITGTVSDSSGAAVPKGQVTITNTEHGVNRTAPANDSGEYLFAALPIGSYDLTVTAGGFKKYEAKGVVLQVAQKARLNVTLEVGTISMEVVVQGSEVAQVETQSSDLGSVVSGKEITQLELNGRDFTSLVGLSPGVTNQSGQDEGGEGATTVAFSVNGGRTEYNNFELDGGDMLDNGSNTTLNVYPSIDAIAEFKVLTSDYGAQYGKNGSGTVEVEVKSGTSHFHGNLYEFLRNDAFNATQFGLTSPPEYKKNDFGGTIGGPVYIPGHYNSNRQKTFFFYSEEWRRDLIPANFFSTTAVPTVANRTGDFSDQCSVPGNPECPLVPAFINGVAQANAGQQFPNNQVPIQNAAIASALTAMIPNPNSASGNLGNTLDQWFAAPTLPTHWRQELFKIDHNINDKVRASFHYIHDSWDQGYPVPLWTDGVNFPTIQTGFKNPGVSMVARLTATVSPTLLNEFVASYTTDHISTTLSGPWQRGNTFGNLGVYNNGFGFSAPEAPGISLTDSVYGFAEDPGYVPEGPINSNPTVGFRDNVTKIVGTHNLQFGFSFVDAHKNELPQPPTGANGILGFSNGSNGAQNSTGNAYADLLLGNITSFTQQQLQLKMHNFYKIYEPYFQDDWHVTRRLTLNLGLRFSFYGTYRELNNLAFNFDPGRFVLGNSGVDTTGNVTGAAPGNPLFNVTPSSPYNGWVQCGVTVGVPKGCMKDHWWNPAPRLGFAFDPFGDGKWAVRGGYGIFFEHMNGNESNTDLLEPFDNKTQTTTVTNNTAGNLSGYASLNPGLLGAGSPPIIVGSIPSKVNWPYMQEWHLDVQHEIARGTVATLSYVGSVGVHLTRAYELNQILPASFQPGGNPYLPGQVITASDCSNISNGTDTVDAYGVPTNAVTSYGAVVPYTAGVGGGPPSGAAVNLSVACGNSPNAFRPFAGYGSIGRKDQTASSNYNALEASVRRSIGGLQLNLAYTYSHSIDNASSANDAGLINTYALNTFRASSNFDQRHTFTFAYVYDLPFFKKSGLAHKVLGGWQWSGITLVQSGTPFSVYNKGNGTIAPGDNAGVGNLNSQIDNLGSLTAGSYPDLVGNPRTGVQNTPSPGFGPLLYNPAAFVAPTGLTFGDAGRNILNNPWRTNFDMALIKHFPITESKYFEFRAEAFNVFNHTEFAWLGGDGGSAGSNSGQGNADSTIGCYGGANNSAGDSSCVSSTGLTPGFLRPGSAHEARILQLALKFIF